MSYRNPTYYGIVEDVSAFDKAFQTAFNNVKSQIDADKAEKEKRENLIEEMKAGDITSITNIAKNLPIELQKTAINYYSSIIDRGINYEDMDAVERAKIDQTIQLHASGLGNMNEIIQNYEDYENVPEQMKTTIAMLASGKIKPSFDADDIKIGNYGLSEIAIAFNNANKISGTSDYSAGLVNNISNNLLKKLQIQQDINKRNLTDGDIQTVVNGYIKQNKSILDNEQNDYIWKNLISDERKEQDGMSIYGYDLNRVAKEDRKKFEIKRDAAIADYIAEQTKISIKNSIPAYKPIVTPTSQLTANQAFKNSLIISNFERYKSNIASLDNLLATDPKNTIAIRQAATKAGFNTTVVGIGDSENPQNFQYTFRPIDRTVANSLTDISITTGENYKPGDNIQTLALGIGAGYSSENAISNIPMSDNKTYGQFQDEANQAVQAALQKTQQEEAVKQDFGVGNIDKAKQENKKEYDLAIQDIPKNYNNWSGRISVAPGFRKEAVKKAKETHAKLLSSQAAAKKILENKYPNTIWPWNN